MFTWRDWVRILGANHHVEVDDALVNYILWEKTEFPLASSSVVLSQIDEFFDSYEYQQARII